jgi:hypothetical protein
MSFIVAVQRKFSSFHLSVLFSVSPTVSFSLYYKFVCLLFCGRSLASLLLFSAAQKQSLYCVYSNRSVSNNCFEIVFDEFQTKKKITLIVKKCEMRNNKLNYSAIHWLIKKWILELPTYLPHCPNFSTFTKQVNRENILQTQAGISRCT